MPMCGKCDSCISCIEHDIQDLPDAIEDITELLEVTKSFTAQHPCITPKDIIYVYTHAKTKDMENKGYLTSEAYKRIYNRKVLIAKELAFQALQDLVISGYVKQTCFLKKERKMTCSTYIECVKEKVIGI
jgi:hypothetical protein